MYTGGLGVVARMGVDSFGDPCMMTGDTPCFLDMATPVDGDPIALTPTVIQTIDYGGSSPVVHSIDPVAVDSTMIPQQLPTLIVNASAAQAGIPGWAWVGLGLLALWGLSKGGGGRSGRSW